MKKQTLFLQRHSVKGRVCDFPTSQKTWAVASQGVAGQGVGRGGVGAACMCWCASASGNLSLGPLSRKCVRPNAHLFSFSDTCIIKSFLQYFRGCVRPHTTGKNTLPLETTISWGPRQRFAGESPFPLFLKLKLCKCQETGRSLTQTGRLSGIRLRVFQ